MKDVNTEVLLCEWRCSRSLFATVCTESCPSHHRHIRTNKSRQNRSRLKWWAAAPPRHRPNSFHAPGKETICVTHVCVCRDVTTGGSDKIGVKEVKKVWAGVAVFSAVFGWILRPASRPLTASGASEHQSHRRVT